MNELIIRDAVMEDAEGLLKIYSYYVKNTAISMEYEAPDQEVLWMEKMIGEHKDGV